MADQDVDLPHDLDRAAELRERAVRATNVSFTITDPTLEDHPLVWVNPAFTETTGYTYEESVGRNCRFLQGAHTDPLAIQRLKDSLDRGEASTTTLLNYRKDGSAFWNELSVTPVHDADGHLTHFVGVQADVTARVEAEQARTEALTQVAQSADRLALLADFTSRLALAQHPDQVVELLAEALVPRVGAWCLVFTAEQGRVARPFARHERMDDPRIAERLDALCAVIPEQLQESSPVWRVLDGRESEILIRDYSAAPTEITGASSDERTVLLHELGVRSVAVLPLRARSGIRGCVALVADETRPPIGVDELALLRDLTIRGALMLENTQLYARERAAAATLQRSLLPRVPNVPFLTTAADYVPAADEAAVGGDWYDVFPLRGNGGVGVVVGDVMGHDIDAAARMGKLSTIVRSYGWPGSAPHTVLTAVDELLVGSGLDILATCLYATLTPNPDGMTLRYASAGHPPALVRYPDGSAHRLDDGRSVMIGVSRLLPDGAERPDDAVLDLPRGSTLICFTDGLTDAVGAEPDLDAGLAELCRLLTRLPVDAPPRVILDSLTAAAVRHGDDVAVVAMRID